ncbi:MAG: rhodanese-like domain-containing protein [Gammaproteobacteria bacterium]|nr:rhodanese-like domain-containing protein [Gammaproteobacteria bacterium]
MKHSLALTSLLTLFLFNTNVFAEVEGISTGAQLQAVAEKNTTFIETKELKIMLDEELDMVLIDIRTAAEIQNINGKIDAPQNVNIPRGWLEFRAQRVALSKDTPIVVYCGRGLRSPFAAETLQKMGYTNVKNYSAGFFGWKQAGLPVKP